MPTLVPLIRQNLTGRYYEPCVGGGSVFLELAPSRAALSDINAELIEAWAVVAEDPDRLVDAIWRFSNTAECFYRVRKQRPRTEIGRAARFIYLNRTAWGGVYRVNGRGEFNVPFGNSGRSICRRHRIVDASRVLQGAELRAGDFEGSIGRAGPGDVVYLDPPYVGPTTTDRESFQRYSRKQFAWSDQVRLAESARHAVDRGAVVVASARAGQFVQDLYRGWAVLPVQRSSRLSREIKGRGAFDELLIVSPNADLGELTSRNRASN